MKTLILFYVALILLCCGIAYGTGSGLKETATSTLFVLAAVTLLIVLPGAWLSRRRPWLRNLRLRRPPPFSDAQLGKLRFSFGFDTCLWRGSITLPTGISLPLAVSGNADRPDPVALAIAKALPDSFPAVQAPICQALFDHFEPYAEAIAVGEFIPTEPLPSISGPSDTWQHICWNYVAVMPIDGNLVTEIGFLIPWDEEHTLAARIAGETLIELNGSVVRP